MRYLLLTVAFATLFGSANLLAQKKAKDLEKDKQSALNSLNAKADQFGTVAHRIWELAEVGYQEVESSKILQNELQAAGFTIQSGVAGIPTAFVASYGSGEPVIGILGEFDALPGVSQAAVPFRQERPEVNAGHACGHHLFGTASAAAAITVKEWLQKTGQSGTIRFYGTPAEEGGAGKVYMVRAGLFDDVSTVIHWHPSSLNGVSAGSSLANKSAKFRFYGQASHAAGAPERGRSALDGVEAMDFMVNMMREHVPEDARIHYVITRGGEAPNVVPAFAEVYYYVRHPEMQVVKDLFERVVQAAEGAAQGTGTRMDYEVIHGIYNLLPNDFLARLMHRNLEQVGGVIYNQEELQFAETIFPTLNQPNAKISAAAQIEPYVEKPDRNGGSTDVGDISWMVPTVGMGAATWVPGTSAHSWQAVAAGGTSIGQKGMMVAAKAMTLTAMDLFANPALCTEARAELERRRGPGFRYEALLGDREPPLDYRK
ncbi:MAG: amidohydrolase [Lewinellaceae bacterium]|nr:amidohydrolase [Lewinellaceae bacterium]